MPESKGKGNSKTQNEDQKPIKVNKWDGNATKHALDDAVRTLISDKHDYKELTRYIDMRLFLATVAVGFALFALLWDWMNPFPKSKPILILCVVAYFTLMGALQLYSMLVEKGIFFVAVDKDPTGKHGDVYWTFSSNMKRFDHMYSLDIEFTSADKRSHGKASLTKSIGAWFDDEGSLLKDAFAADVYKLKDSLASGKKEK